MEISEFNLSTIEARKSLNEYRSKCKDELELLTSKMFENCKLFYLDILKIKDVAKLAGLARNEYITNVLKPDNFIEKFPVYGALIVEHFNAGVLRNKDFDLVKRFIQYLSTRDYDQLPQLPLTAVSEIFTYLNFEDVTALRKL